MAATSKEDARFEFRCWARHFGPVGLCLDQVRSSEGIRESDEIYIVSMAGDINVKVRDDALDVKKLTQTQDDLEQWRPLSSTAFPLSVATLACEILPALGTAAPEGLSGKAHSVDRFLRDVVFPNSRLNAAAVSKRRVAFTLTECMAEIVEVRINGAELHTLALESTDPAAVTAARRRLHMEAMENLSYPAAIRRVVGMEPLRTPC